MFVTTPVSYTHLDVYKRQTYRNILYQSDISGQDAQSASIPRMFFPVGWKCQPEEGGIGPGCCGGGVITTWATGDGVIAAGPAV